MTSERVAVTSPNTLTHIEHNLSMASVIQERIQLVDDSETQITTVYAKPNTNFDLVWNPQFENPGIITEPGSTLISQPLTRDLWGKPVGQTPQQYLYKHNSIESLGICPSNANWQMGAFLVKDGKVHSPDKNLNGSFDVIGKSISGEWFARGVFLDENNFTQGTVADMKIGLSVPLIVNDGVLVPLMQIIGDPRLTADLRNVFNFAAGKKVPNEFWNYFRRLLPSDKHSGKRLLDSNSVVVKHESALNDEEYTSFQTIISDYGLGEHLKLDKKDGVPRLALFGQFPLQRLPVVGIGFNKDGNFMACAADGRQKDHSGISIEELARIMLDRGAVCAGLGSAGGDVSVVLKEHGSQMTVINSPSNIDEQNNNVTRLEPSQLILY